MKFVIFSGKPFEQRSDSFVELAQALVDMLRRDEIGLEWYSAEVKRLLAQAGW